MCSSDLRWREPPHKSQSHSCVWGSSQWSQTSGCRFCEISWTKIYFFHFIRIFFMILKAFSESLLLSQSYFLGQYTCMFFLYTSTCISIFSITLQIYWIGFHFYKIISLNTGILYKIHLYIYVNIWRSYPAPSSSINLLAIRICRNMSITRCITIHHGNSSMKHSYKAI